ncbi:MAG TPA: diguanylate cyclase [Solirubrobacterales bacterium]|nr:diguanylate cyclase [Solirubrobacterales bacterium]
MSSRLKDSLDPLQAWHSGASGTLPGLSVLVYDTDLRVISCEGDPPHSVDVDPEAMIGRPLADALPPSMWGKLEAALKGALNGVRSSFQMPFSDGDCLHWLDVDPLRSDGAVIGGTLASQDVAERMIAEQELRVLTGSFEAAFTKAPIGMAMVALDGTLVRVNPAFNRITGYTPEEIAQLRFQDMIPTEDHERDLGMTNRLISGELNTYTAEKRIHGKDQREIWAMIATSVVRDGEDRPLHLIAQIQDISERRELELELRRVAGEDPLTGLANRRRFDRTLEDQIERSRRYGETAALLMIDLDDFKSVNDTHGHSTGDDLLNFVGRQITARIRSTDLVARLGGDEFTVILLGADARRAENLVAELTAHFDSLRFEPEGRAISCRASIGSALIDASTGSMDEVLSAADRSMYEAKRSRERRP